MSRKVRFLSLLMAVVFVFSACGSSGGSNNSSVGGNAGGSNTSGEKEPAPETPKSEVRYVVGTAASTGTHYAIGVAISEAVNAKSSYLRLTPQVTEGGDANAMLVGGEELPFGFVNSETSYSYKNGLNDLPYLPNLQAICTLQANCHHLIARLDSGIDTLQDVKGKRVGMPTGHSNETLVKAALLYYGIDWDKDLAKGEITTSSDVIEKLGDGELDLIYVGGAAPLGTVIELMTTGKYKLISVPEEDLLEIYKQGYEGKTLDATFSPTLIPANTYPNQDYDVVCSSVFNTIVTHENVPEEDVYELCKMIYENWETIRASHASIANKDVSELPKVLIDMHPGAERFYKEVGLIG